MIRARFRTDAKDWRPLNWPLKHPCWCTGYVGSKAIVIAFVDDEKEIRTQWPDATDIDVKPATEGYEFAERFPQPAFLQSVPSIVGTM